MKCSCSRGIRILSCRLDRWEVHTRIPTYGETYRRSARARAPAAEVRCGIWKSITSALIYLFWFAEYLEEVGVKSFKKTLYAEGLVRRWVSDAFRSSKANQIRSRGFISSCSQHVKRKRCENAKFHYSTPSKAWRKRSNPIKRFCVSMTNMLMNSPNYWAFSVS